MAKTHKNVSREFFESDMNDDYRSKKNSGRNVPRFVEKRMRTALNTLDVDALMEIDEMYEDF